MKACKFCNTQVENTVQHCPSCGSAVFLHVCENCGTLFDSSFCPNCGVKAGQKKKICPDCGSAYFTNACPNCGYTPSRKPIVQKVEQTVVHKHVYEEAPSRASYTPTQARQAKKKGKGCGCGTIILVFIVLALLFGNRSGTKKNTTTTRTTNTTKVTTTAKTTAKSGPTNTPAPTATPEPDVAAAQEAVNKYYTAMAEAGETPDPDTLTTSQKAGITVRYTLANSKGQEVPATAYAPEVEKASWKDSRGQSSYSSSEPDYIGVLGYASVYDEFQFEKNGTFTQTPWQITVFQPDRQFWQEAGTIAHKTQVVVIGQKLEKKSYKQYKGYLHVIRMDTGEDCWIDVVNFVTEPYWEKSLNSAWEEGYCIATFWQVSNYYPVTKGNEKTKLEDGTLVLLPMKTKVSGSSPDKTNNPIGAVVYKEWKYGFGGVTVWFNEADLTLSY
ncbi:MAG: zinc ribbon domain-containing protein [Clostridia bacterium]|nr:zinc ribbon domain-containing protein [Clostridia bacterium]